MSVWRPAGCPPPSPCKRLQLRARTILTTHVVLVLVQTSWLVNATAPARLLALAGVHPAPSAAPPPSLGPALPCCVHALPYLRLLAAVCRCKACSSPPPASSRCAHARTRVTRSACRTPRDTSVQQASFAVFPSANHANPSQLTKTASSQGVRWPPYWRTPPPSAPFTIDRCLLASSPLVPTFLSCLSIRAGHLADPIACVGCSRLPLPGCQGQLRAACAGCRSCRTGCLPSTPRTTFSATATPPAPTWGSRPSTQRRCAPLLGRPTRHAHSGRCPRRRTPNINGHVCLLTPRHSPYACMQVVINYGDKWVDDNIVYRGSNFGIW